MEILAKLKEKKEEMKTKNLFFYFGKKEKE